MIDRKIAKIKVRRGFDSERKTVMFSEGELIYVIDKKRMYIGDGTTLGGVPISNKHFITSTETIPANAIEGDIIYQKNTDITYILGYDNADTNKTTLLKYPIFTKYTYLDLQEKIDDLYTKLNALLALTV
jgi:hypothetical protein